MVKNIVFDLGGVLIDFDPDRTLARFFRTEDAQQVHRVLFEGDLWPQLDLGRMSLLQIADEACKTLPAHLHTALRDMLGRWWSFMPPIDGMEEFVRALKENGYRVYLLSNTSDDLYKNFQNYPVLSLMDGVIASCDYGVLKPDPRLYRALYAKYALDPSECFFVDDMPQNIEGAAKTGMTGFCFAQRNLDKLREAMRKEGITI